MGSQYLAKCSSCEEESVVRKGGGLNFFLLLCDLCGANKNVYLDEKYGTASLYHYLYRNGLPESSKIKLTEILEQIAGACLCGGQFKRDAKPRCKNCKSDEIYRIESLWDGILD